MRIIISGVSVNRGKVLENEIERLRRICYLPAVTSSQATCRGGRGLASAELGHQGAQEGLLRALFWGLQAPAGAAWLAEQTHGQKRPGEPVLVIS